MLFSTTVYDQNRKKRKINDLQSNIFCLILYLHFTSHGKKKQKKKEDKSEKNKTDDKSFNYYFAKLRQLTRASKSN